MNVKKKLLVFLLSFIIFFVLRFDIHAGTCDGLSAREKVDCLTNVLSDLSAKSRTLQNQIAQFNAQINLTELKIEQTQEQIALLGGRIDQLEVSLQALTQAFSSRAVATYKMARSGESFFLLITSENLTKTIERFHYLQRAQVGDHDLLVRLQGAQNTYKQNKTEQEKLEAQLAEQKQALDSQKMAKSNLLAVTRNDESRYNELLRQAQRELEALANSQFVGKKDVKRGDVIGLMGSTGFSTGPHLHFGYYNIRQEEADSLFGSTEWYFTRNESPMGALQSRTLHFEYLSCDDVQQYSGADKAIGSGSDPWPMSNPVITQCYGHTPYSYVYRGNFHQGLDMADVNDVFVKAVDDGVAYFYRGTSSFGNNVRIFHSNGKMSLYMHLQ